MSEDDKKQLIIDYKQTFEPPAGQRVLADLKKKSKILLSTVPMDNDGKLDSHMLAYEYGKRSHTIHIYTQLGKDPYEVKQTKAINYERKNDE